MRKRFHWDEWNIEHISKHRVTRAEAEFVAGRAAAPFPRAMDSEKSLVRGPTASGRMIQVIYVLHEAEDFQYET